MPCGLEDALGAQHLLHLVLHRERDPRSSRCSCAPTCSWRGAVCSIMRARNAGALARVLLERHQIGVRAQCLCTISDSVGDAQQLQRMASARVRLGEAALDLVPGHRAVAGVVVGLGVLHALRSPGAPIFIEASRNSLFTA